MALHSFILHRHLLAPIRVYCFWSKRNGAGKTASMEVLIRRVRVMAMANDVEKRMDVLKSVWVIMRWIKGAKLALHTHLSTLRYPPTFSFGLTLSLWPHLPSYLLSLSPPFYLSFLSFHYSRSFTALTVSHLSFYSILCNTMNWQPQLTLFCLVDGETASIPLHSLLPT